MDDAKEHFDRVCQGQVFAHESWVDGLPDFNPKAPCPYCGANGAELNFQKPPVFSNHSSMQMAESGSIRHTCGRCKADWSTKTIEAPLSAEGKR